MKRNRPERPERMYESEVRRFWPNFPEDDDRLYDLQKAYIEATSTRSVDVEGARRTGSHLEWKPIPPSTTRPLLRVVCTHSDHFDEERPMLAELWRSDAHGPLFLSRLPGAAFDPPDDPANPFATPTAVLPRKERDARRRLLPPPSAPDVWEALPVTIVRIFLEDPTTSEAELWIKCNDHGAGKIDRLKLYRAYLEDVRNRSQGRDTREPTVIGLHTVGAVSLT